jgi:uncharacterized protein YdhG (YjbR/CyaY superfamily)
MPKPDNVEAYLASFPKETQAKLSELRATVKGLVPDATEIISYAMPAFKWNGL